ncbi:hypothetical protein JTB14_011159 [Gonioctena quinquepunctata]|nr:hypothetical protein JTB14_011159 [Gonioctena quinquepunctata]
MFDIPETKLPECLKDEERINVLFAPLRSRSVNPKDYHTKISSWKTIIKSYCEAKEKFTFTPSLLNNVFIKNGRPPSCLGEVLSDMQKSGEIQQLDLFLRKTSHTWSGWAADMFIKKPICWSYDKIKKTMLSSDGDQQSFAYLDIIKTKCECLIRSLPENKKNKLISLKDLLEILQKTDDQADDVKLLLHYLSNQHIIDVTTVGNGKQKNELDTILVKFGSVNGNEFSPISETDRGIYILEQNEKMLSNSIEDLEDCIQSCVQEAKMHLSRNHRQMAKTALKKKHDLEKRLEKKANALHNIQNLLDKVHETHNDAHVWEAYKSAVSAFDVSFKESGLSEDAIDDTMIKLGEMLDKQQDIQSALAQPGQESIDSDLEEELTELMKDEPHDQPPDDNGLNTSDIKGQLEKLTLNLPEVSDVNPSVTVEEKKVAIL